MFVNAGPVPLQNMLSTCKSPKMALIFARLFCVPPVAFPPGVLAAARTLTPGGDEFPAPVKLTLAVDACAGANSMKVVGFLILSADIAALFTS